MNGKKEMWTVRRLAIALLLLLALVPPVWGDSAPMASVGPGVEPMDSTTVRLAEERIEIHLSRDQSGPLRPSRDAVGDFRVWFRFEPEADEEMTVGFPLFIYDLERSIFGARIEDLRVEVDGREVPVEIRESSYGKENPDADPAEWAVYPVRFRAGQPLEMVVRYRMPVAGYGKGFGAPFWVSYVLRTGAHWAGPIGRVEAVITMDRPIREEDIVAQDALRTTTPGWVLEDGALRWVWEDVEPDFDLYLVLKNPYWLDLHRDARATLDAGVAAQVEVLRVLGATQSLFEADEIGQTSPLRDGLTPLEAAEALLPDVLTAARAYLGDHPGDAEVREAYFSLLQQASLVPRYDGQQWVTALRSEERLAYTLAELTRFARGGDLPGYLLSWRPWTHAGLTDYPWQPETQEAIAAFLAAVMPASFDTAQAAEEWVSTNAGNALAAGHAEDLLAQARERVRLVLPATETEGGSSTGTAGPAAAGEGTTGASGEEASGEGDGEAAEGSRGVALLIVGLCLALGAAGTATLWTWRRAHGREHVAGR